MKSLITLTFIVGLFMVVSGIYEQKVMDALESKKVEYRFIPRSAYEEQMDSTQVSTNTRAMFDANPLTTGGRGLTV
jgi:hypothetical protein